MIGQDVLILGAGFSRAISELMPVTDELGTAAIQAAELTDDPRIPSDSFSPTFTFENWLSLLAEDQPYLSEADNLGNRALFAKLVELDAHTVDALKAWKALQGQERLLVGPGYHSEEKLIFTLPDGRGYHPERFSREFERKQATYNRLNPSIPLPRLRLHDLRHTWATLALAAGIHPKVVQERLGHSSIATTMNVYSHALPGMQSQAAEQVSAMFFQSEG